ncbi:MAG TPA: amino acid racemase [Chthoniobacterales bacterium]|nr:amino acid racemase [Chthoniobacterales bacterium]
MKLLGIIGGIGPESTVDYYQTIVGLYRARKSDGSYPALVINSVDMQRLRKAFEANDLAAIVDYILPELHRLQRAGADFGLLAANTPHLVFDDLQRQSPIPLISIVAVTCDAARTRGLKRLALFGTRFTMTARLYPDVFSKEGIAVVIPEPADQDYIHEKYLGELVNGIFLPETRAGLLAIVDRMVRQNGIDGVILGGTELPLILREPDHNGTPFLNTTRIHCEAAVERMFS